MPFGLGRPSRKPSTVAYDRQLSAHQSEAPINYSNGHAKLAQALSSSTRSAPERQSPRRLSDGLRNLFRKPTSSRSASAGLSESAPSTESEPSSALSDETMTTLVDDHVVTLPARPSSRATLRSSIPGFGRRRSSGQASAGSDRSAQARPPLRKGESSFAVKSVRNIARVNEGEATPDHQNTHPAFVAQASRPTTPVPTSPATISVAAFRSAQAMRSASSLRSFSSTSLHEGWAEGEPPSWSRRPSDARTTRPSLSVLTGDPHPRSHDRLNASPATSRPGSYMADTASPRVNKFTLAPLRSPEEEREAAQAFANAFPIQPKAMRSASTPAISTPPPALLAPQPIRPMMDRPVLVYREPTSPRMSEFDGVSEEDEQEHLSDQSITPMSESSSCDSLDEAAVERHRRKHIVIPPPRPPSRNRSPGSQSLQYPNARTRQSSMEPSEDDEVPLAFLASKPRTRTQTAPAEVSLSAPQAGLQSASTIGLGLPPHLASRGSRSPSYDSKPKVSSRLASAPDAGASKPRGPRARPASFHASQLLQQVTLPAHLLTPTHLPPEVDEIVLPPRPSEVDLPQAHHRRTSSFGGGIPSPFAPPTRPATATGFASTTNSAPLGKSTMELRWAEMNKRLQQRADLSVHHTTIV
ncbi:uncharacterized protein L969DRAFT_99191 [Mixia osmundae IAM 14324]|nr:uncharacterized protein L969DRAFT_99191 [Mixia osmundae IAM 14324]KEI38685.1 hypothetical protein L969DRAFT_99191 [Mixia osmundae IAM 14324]